jgi:ubiquinone/menaquinone biosynthesis C-methylase UbiE
MVPRPGRRTLDLGCGEGRVARDLEKRGHRVVGVDASPTLLRSAHSAHPAGRYVVGDARALPFPERSFDLAVAYNSLMDIEDMPLAVAETGRVLDPGGRFSVCVTHPVAEAGRFAGREPNAPFVIKDSYFGRRPFVGSFERDGLTMTFRGWCYPLEDYAEALEEAGFVIERLREPAASKEAVAHLGTGEIRWQRVPMFLQILAVRR